MSGLEPKKRHKRKGRKKKGKEKKVGREVDQKGKQRARNWMNFLSKIRQSQVYSYLQKEVSPLLARGRSSNQGPRQRLANLKIQLEVSQRKKGTDPSQRIGETGKTKTNELRNESY